MPTVHWLDDPLFRSSVAQSPIPMAVLDADDTSLVESATWTAEPDRSRVELPLSAACRLVWRTDAAAGERIAALEARLAELEQLSATDRLTGAWNRHHLERTVRREIGGALRYRHPLSMLLFDVDHFKKINDTFGHSVGDQVLQALTAAIVGGTRPSDSLYRWGGEEFVLLAPDTAFADAAVVAERVRGVIEAHEFPRVGRVTVSVGVAELLVGEDLAAWFERADRAVYAAKAAGRNRVSCDRRGASEVWSHSSHGVLELVFRERYRSGHPAIDQEHAQLFELANKVLAASAVGYDDPSELRRALDELVHHVTVHFAHEESLLAEIGYPRLSAHRLAHARLLGEAVRLQTAAAGRRVPPGELVDFLARDVVARHLLVADGEFFPLLQGTASTRA